MYGAAKTRDIGRAYRQQEILTAPRERIITYMFQGLETFLVQAKSAIERGEIARSGELIGRAQGIVWELLGALDMERGADVAANLARLYRFMINRLVEGNLRKDGKPLDEVLSVLAPIKDGWNEMLEQRNRRP